MSNSTSFNGVEAWYQRTREELDLKCPVVLCGNKIDLPTSVDKEEVELWAESHDCSLCFTSAKDGTNINAAFEYLAKNCQIQKPITEPLPVQESQKCKC